MIIAVVALIVIGPEKLPKLARTLGAFTGRMQRFMAQVKDEVNREMRFEELQKLQQEIQEQASQIKVETQTQLNKLKTDVELNLQTNFSEAAPLESFELTPPHQKPRNLSQFTKQPSKLDITPLVTEIAEVVKDSKPTPIKKPKSKPAKSPLAKSATNKKASHQV